MHTPAQLLRRITLVALLSTLLITVAGSTTLAQEAPESSLTASRLSLTAIPTQVGQDFSLSLDPGEMRQIQLKVINTGTQSITIRSLPQDFVVFDQSQTPTPVNTADADNRWSLASWITLAPAIQTIPAGGIVSLNAIITVPEDALPGGHYAMVLHQPNLDPQDILQNLEENTQASAVTQRVGTLVYVKVNGFINEDAIIRDLQIPNFSEFGPIPFSFTVENLSDIHIQPRISVEITNFFGKRVDTQQLDQRNIFPMTSLEYEGKWDRIWGFGLYNAKVIMSYGESNAVEATQRFWLLPVTLIIAIIVVLLVLIVAWIAVRRHLVHRRQEQQKRIDELESKLEKMKSSNTGQFED